MLLCLKLKPSGVLLEKNTILVPSVHIFNRLARLLTLNMRRVWHHNFLVARRFWIDLCLGGDWVEKFPCSLFLTLPEVFTAIKWVVLGASYMLSEGLFDRFFLFNHRYRLLYLIFLTLCGFFRCLVAIVALQMLDLTKVEHLARSLRLELLLCMLLRLYLILRDSWGSSALATANVLLLISFSLVRGLTS